MGRGGSVSSNWHFDVPFCGLFLYNWVEYPILQLHPPHCQYIIDSCCSFWQYNLYKHLKEIKEEVNP